ncbi:hypothetical protein AHiyo6_36170, partial [Arthrobacter sp. Hiyo6]
PGAAADRDVDEQLRQELESSPKDRARTS